MPRAWRADAACLMLFEYGLNQQKPPVAPNWMHLWTVSLTVRFIVRIRWLRGCRKRWMRRPHSTDRQFSYYVHCLSFVYASCVVNCCHVLPIWFHFSILHTLQPGDLSPRQGVGLKAEGFRLCGVRSFQKRCPPVISYWLMLNNVEALLGSYDGAGERFREGCGVPCGCYKIPSHYNCDVIFLFWKLIHPPLAMKFDTFFTPFYSIPGEVLRCQSCTICCFEDPAATHSALGS